MSSQRVKLNQALVDVVLYVRPSNSLRAELTKRLSGAHSAKSGVSPMGHSIASVYLSHSHSEEEADRLTKLLGCSPEVASQLIHQGGASGIKSDLLLRFCYAVGLNPFDEDEAQQVADAAYDALLPQRTQ